MPTDPVCGMFVPETSDLFITKDGEKYYFCSKGCMEKFTSPSLGVKTLKTKLALAWSLSIPIMLIQYLFSSLPFKDYVELILAIPVLFYSGSGFFEGAYHTIRSRMGNMDLLIALGTGTAFVFSLFITLFPKAIPGSSVYFDASVFIITLILTGTYIETLTKEKANSAASKLKEIIPEYVHYVSPDGTVSERRIDEIHTGDMLLCKPGDIIPADGNVLKGSSEVDQSIITGEQNPVLKAAGDSVTAGTLNINGSLSIIVEKIGKESTINHVYRLIQNATMGRVKIQRVADTFSALFIPVVITAAISAGIFWYFYLTLTGHTLALQYAVLAFVSVVVIACPCAIGLAAPITLLISSSASSENGILLKNPGSLERLSKTTIVLFDKTGTLTIADPQITEVKTEPGFDLEAMISMAAAVEKMSNHPIAKAIVKYSQKLNLKIPEASDIVETPGIGISGKVADLDIRISRSSGATSSIVSIEIGGNTAGHISLAYKVRDTAHDSISILKEMGIKTAMITGDMDSEARKIGLLLGITDIHSGLMPEDKAQIVTKYQESGEFVVFVGDGINDSAAMETADTGIAMGSGLDIARESGDIILLNDDLTMVAYSIILGKNTISKIRQNIGWAIGYNSVLIPIAAGLLVPVFGLSIFSILPILAALAMGLSSTSVVLNSLRLRSKITRSVNRITLFNKDTRTMKRDLPGGA